MDILDLTVHEFLKKYKVNCIIDSGFSNVKLSFIIFDESAHDKYQAFELYSLLGYIIKVLEDNGILYNVNHRDSIRNRLKFLRSVDWKIENKKFTGLDIFGE